MDQTKLFYDDINDAIGTVVMSLGGYKKVGHMLRPNMKIESAYAWLKECVKPNGDQHLDQHEMTTLIREGRKVGCHAIMEYWSRDAGYETKPKEPEDERAELRRKVVNAVGEFSALVKRLEQLEAK